MRPPIAVKSVAITFDIAARLAEPPPGSELGEQGISLRINAPAAAPAAAAPAAVRDGAAVAPAAVTPAATKPTPDEWSSRIAKLIPAEALGLFGTATAFLGKPAGESGALDSMQHNWLWGIIAVCALLSILVRKQAGAQNVAIAISLVSFAIWPVALPPPWSPVPLSASTSYAGPLIALLWGTIVPFFYKGDAPAQR